MQIYHYHPVTHGFTASGLADASPLEPGVFLVPANATTIQPPSVAANQAAVFNGASWEVVPDHRGEVYYLADGSQHTITELGVTPPVGSSPIKPEPTIEQIRAGMRVSAWQLRRALTQLNLREAVEAAIAQSDQDTKDMWEYSTTYERMHPMVSAIATALNKTDADIDELFNLALTFTQ